jgi:hypothetical protein
MHFAHSLIHYEREKLTRDWEKTIKNDQGKKELDEEEERRYKIRIHLHFYSFSFLPNYDHSEIYVFVFLQAFVVYLMGFLKKSHCM